MRVFLTGATGLIGRRLLNRLLDRGDTVVPLSRKPFSHAPASAGKIEPLLGDPGVAGSWLEVLKSCDAVVHLAGEPILGRRWTDRVLKQLFDSRVLSTRLIANTLAANPRWADGTPKVLLSGSAVGIYGANSGSTDQFEDSPAASDTLAKICIEWEAAASPAAKAGVRVVHPRTGIVLDPDGGALPPMLRQFRLFAGGRMGSGRQFMPWIHRDDMTALLLHLLDQEACSGPFNACSPNPVTNSEFSRVLGTVLHRPNWLPVPRFAIRVLMGQVVEVVVGGQRALPTKLLGTGFAFRFAELEPALRDLLHRPFERTAA